MVSPVALLLVEGGDVAQERERVVDRFDGELSRGRRPGNGREMDPLHRLDGTGRESETTRDVFAGGPFK